MSPYPKLDRLAARQQQVVTYGQCVEMGLSGRHIVHCVQTGQMYKVRRSVYRWCGTRTTWRMLAMAAVLAGGESTVLSHSSAAALWGLVSEHDGDVLEITAAWRCRLDGVKAHRHQMPAEERTTRFSIPVTTIERTLLDIAETTHQDTLGHYIDDALRRRLTTIAKLAAALDRHEGPGRRRTAAMRAALVDRGVGYDPGANDWEQRMDRLWEEWGLPPAVRQHQVGTKRRKYVLDRAILDAKIGIEWNGRWAHGTRSSFDYDSDRRADLVAAGWLMLDFTPRSSPARIVRAVRKAYEERKALLLLSA